MKKVQQYIYGQKKNDNGYGIILKSMRSKCEVERHLFLGGVDETRIELTYIEKENKYALIYSKRLKKGDSEQRSQLLEHGFILEEEILTYLLSDKKRLAALISLPHIKSRNEVSDTTRLEPFDIEKINIEELQISSSAEKLAEKLKKYVIASIFSEKTYVAVTRQELEMGGISSEELIIALISKIPLHLRKFLGFNTNVHQKVELNEHTKLAIFASNDVEQTNGPIMKRLLIGEQIDSEIEEKVSRYFELLPKEQEKITSGIQKSKDLAEKVLKVRRSNDKNQVVMNGARFFFCFIIYAIVFSISFSVVFTLIYCLMRANYCLMRANLIISGVLVSCTFVVGVIIGWMVARFKSFM